MQKVTIVDSTAPELTVPDDVTAEQVDANGTAVDIGDATATDTCDAAPAITSDAPLVFPLGTTTVTWTATDASGNTASARQVVTVVDTTAPAIAAPDGLEVWEADPRGTHVDLGQPTVGDACDAQPDVGNDAPGVFLLGTTTVTWTATDESGNSASAMQFVAIVPGSPSNQLGNLSDVIQYGVDDGKVAPEIEGALLAKVDAAQAALIAGNPNAAKVAINDLKALVHQVEAQTDKKIAPDVAADIIARANRIIAALGG
jgi:hypothetical protein